MNKLKYYIGRFDDPEVSVEADFLDMQAKQQGFIYVEDNDSFYAFNFMNMEELESWHYGEQRDVGYLSIGGSVNTLILEDLSLENIKKSISSIFSSYRKEHLSKSTRKEFEKASEGINRADGLKSILSEI